MRIKFWSINIGIKTQITIPLQYQICPKRKIIIKQAFLFRDPMVIFGVQFKWTRSTAAGGFHISSPISPSSRFAYNSIINLFCNGQESLTNFLRREGPVIKQMSMNAIGQQETELFILPLKGMEHSGRRIISILEDTVIV